MASSLADGWDRFWSLWRSGTWEPATRDLLADHLTPGSLFVDIGAWIGPVTLWALDLGADVIAVEPDPVAAAELHRRAPAAEIWDGAVATHTGLVRLAPNPRRGGEWGDSMSRIDADGTAVEAWTLPEILAGRVPHLVKIDVEGYELDLLPTLGPWLAALAVPVQVSCHGTLPDPAWFAGYARVRYPDTSWGDLVALP